MKSNGYRLGQYCRYSCTIWERNSYSCQNAKPFRSSWAGEVPMKHHMFADTRGPNCTKPLFSIYKAHMLTIEKPIRSHPYMVITIGSNRLGFISQ